MGLFDLEPIKPNAAPDQRRAAPQVQPEPATGLDPLSVVISTVRAANANRTTRRPWRGKELRDAVNVRLRAAGWTCRTRYKVESRGTPDGYRGVLDLVAHPPVPRGDRQLPAPVLIEFDKLTVSRKTTAKLASYEGTARARVIVLARATGQHPPIEGVDEILTLG